IGGPPPSYGQATAGFAPPMQGYAPPMQGYAPPIQGYAPPVSGYAPPLSGYAPPPPQSGMQASTNNKVTVVTVQPPRREPLSQPPPDHMKLAYISCLFCPLVALAAISAARHSRDSYRAGDHEKAIQFGRTARVNAISAICAGIFSAIILMAVYRENIYMF
ncbi:proline-rich transmembrane protein 2-like, partial [Haliotis asinina]|uniref:proline-rich transmembrane protein 2-like n=1 Tax=Haliotis asinina TaxID=109174 RepID=UPI00353259DB